MNNKKALHLIYFFPISTLLIFLTKKYLVEWDFNIPVLYIGNTILFAASLISFYFHYKAMKSGSAMASVRNTTASTMIKFFICAVAAVIYIFLKRQNVNKASLITCFGLYAIYTFLEVRAAVKPVSKNV